MVKQYDLCILAATGAVGEAMLQAVMLLMSGASVKIFRI
jgi:hypothetical protein